MDDDDKIVDLSRNQYREVGGPKRREPFFLPGWWIILLTVGAVLFVKAYLWRTLMDWVR